MSVPTSAAFGAGRVRLAVAANQGRKGARSFVQTVAEAVAPVALAQEESWNDARPERDHAVPTLPLGREGMCRLRGEEGWRELIVGPIGGSDQAGERQPTLSLAAPPEDGQATFRNRMEPEIERVKALYPQARDVGSAEGAKENGAFLEGRTEVPSVDCSQAAGAILKELKERVPVSRTAKGHAEVEKAIRSLALRPRRAEGIMRSGLRRACRLDRG
jgi:hypothetical protein